MGVSHGVLLKVYRSMDNQEKYSLCLVKGSGLSKREKTKTHPTAQDTARGAASNIPQKPV